MFALIYITAFTSIVAFSMVFPLLPVYAKTYGASDVTIGFLAASFAIGQILFSPFWGSLSDHIGRKPIIMVGLIGISASFILFALGKSIETLFISRFFQGVFSSASMPTTRAYIGDITAKDDRVKAMGRIGAAIAMGVILGPAIGGILAKTSVSFPFWVGAVVALANLVFIAKFLPESLAIKTSVKNFFKNQPLPFFQSFKSMKDGLNGSLTPLFILGFIWSFALSTNQLSVPIIGLEKFEAGSQEIGINFAFLGLVSATVQFFFLSKISSLFGTRAAITGGLAIMAFGIFLLPILPSNLMFLYFATLFVGAGSAIARPLITALISQSSTEQGRAMGTENAFESLGRLIGPLIGGFLFGLGTAVPFVFASGVVVTGILLTFLSTWKPTKKIF